MRILVVDDCPYTRELLRGMLVELGYLPTLARDGLDGFPGPYDLALLDLAMPGQDGYELAGQVLELYPDCYVVAVTAHTGPEYQAWAYRVGMREFLSKPVSLADLSGVLERAQKERT